ncbi:hypothetical protein HY988_00975 [Candidatus Micrarchaeota archaeon]|nr:hypothetical protein [Candidatus Micrarchaeota archaeon]
MDLKRSLKCSSCGNEVSIQLLADINVNELVISGKCSHCGSSMQVNYNLIDSSSSSQSSSSSSSSSSGASEIVNIDESLFAPEIPSDTIRDLMEE